LILDSPYKGWDFAQNLMLLNKVHQNGKLDLEYDCSNWRAGKHTSSSHERLVVRPMEIHCEWEKKVGEPNWVEITKHFIATCLEYSSLSVEEGGMKVISPYSFGLPSEG
jgi:hypothetical protein